MSSFGDFWTGVEDLSLEMQNLNFAKPFKQHGGERDSEGNLTDRGRTDFFPDLLDQDNFTREYRDVTEAAYEGLLQGDYKKVLGSWWQAHALGGVMQNPAQGLADPGGFLQAEEFRSIVRGVRGEEEGGPGARTGLAVIIAASVVAAILSGGSSAEAEAGLVAEGPALATSASGSTTGISGSTAINLGLMAESLLSSTAGQTRARTVQRQAIQQYEGAKAIQRAQATMRPGYSIQQSMVNSEEIDFYVQQNEKEDARIASEQQKRWELEESIWNKVAKIK